VIPARSVLFCNRAGRSPEINGASEAHENLGLQTPQEFLEAICHVPGQGIVICSAICYNLLVIKSWRHKGLKKFYETGNRSGIQSEHSVRLKVILQRLDASVKASDMNTPGMRFHQLQGDLKKFYSVSVSGNWRVIFEFERENAFLVDYVDYH
jgi:proteic killer suppression protein